MQNLLFKPPQPDAEAQARTAVVASSHGEFIMSGNMTDFCDAAESDPAAIMPNYLEREEVHAMMKKLRDSVSFWKRIQASGIDRAWDNPDVQALPQHTMYIK